jgi:hypothetical protein
MPDFLRRLLGWLRCPPSYLFLTAGQESIAAQPPERFARAWLGIMVQGLLWGMVLVNVWGLAWMVFGGNPPLIMPAAATLCVFVLWPFRRAVAAFLDLCAADGAASRPVLAAVFVGALGMCFMSLSVGPYKMNEFPPLPLWLEWVRPGATLYRVLLLMPLWGAWSMIITPQFSRAKVATCPAAAAFARGCGAVTAAACLVPPLGGTLFYFHYTGPQSQVVIAAVSPLAAIALGLICCRLAGGLCRRALLAANFLTQVAFLLACLGCR